MLRHEGRARERILLFGGPGTGKTTSWISVAKLAEKTKAPTKFYVIDSDDTVERMLDTEAADVADRVEYAVVNDWPDYTSAASKFIGMMEPHDFLIVDMLTPSWDSVQEHYVEEVFDKGIDDFFLAARKANKKGAALEGWRDWPTINRMYRTWVNKIVSSPGHLIATASVDNVRADTDDKAIIAVYGPYGVKPRGQKHTGHVFHTALVMGCSKPGEWTMTTVKDRGREPWTGNAVTNFGSQYLVKTAGWKL